MRASQSDLSSRGLLWLLDEESLFPGSTDENFVERIFMQFEAVRNADQLIKKGQTERQFVLQHFQVSTVTLAGRSRIGFDGTKIRKADKWWNLACVELASRSQAATQT